ncbi:MAG TPA: TetR family transcriptional regulator [Feifaniaceae bacterium]|nr:TetR family transcriptional regulator [Feifaniaceae bacterium]
MNFQRARTEGQKAIRVNQIVDITVELYNEMPYDAITLTKIASKLDFTRANLYKYFSTKEEIFLVIIERDIKTWADDICGTLERHGSINIQAFSEIWASTLFDHARLIQLLPILNTVIEKNVSVEALTVLKKSMFESFSRISDKITEIIPHMTAELSFLFFNFQMYYAMGLYPATVPNEIQEKAMKLSGMPYKAETFVPAFSKFIVTVLQGLIYQNTNVRHNASPDGIF